MAMMPEFARMEARGHPLVRQFFALDLIRRYVWEDDEGDIWVTEWRRGPLGIKLRYTYPA